VPQFLVFLNLTSRLPPAAFEDLQHGIRIYQGDCLKILAAIPENSVDLVFADPPYFLSNGGITCHAGRMVSVNKGDWGKSKGADANHEFNRAWLAACQRVLKPNGSIWVSGTSHVIHSVGFAMQQLNFKLLNDISWVKPNPPPNLSCRYFTDATETIIWAAKDKKSRHTFNYKRMKYLNSGKQMKSVWTIHVYAKADYLGQLHCNNSHVRDKIRQQLQVLRDMGILEFLGNGAYRLI
jgi:site-specific DNA-methyltransferase (adenine-specific)